MKKLFHVTLKIDSIFEAEVEAESIKEAKKKASLDSELLLLKMPSTYKEKSSLWRMRKAIKSMKIRRARNGQR